VSEVKISAERRSEFGKGGARRTRRAGKVPAVLYGHGEKPLHIALPAREFAAAIRHGGMTQVFDIEVGDARHLALPKAIQRDPIRDTFDHVDLLIVKRGEKVTVEIPVQLTGEAAKDTLVMHESDRIAVLGDATNLPDHLEASIEGLAAGGQVTAGAIDLPEGVELAVAPETTIAVVTAAPTAEQLEAEAGVVEEAPQAEVAEGEAAEAGAAETPEGAEAAETAEPVEA
jgi:large subunit ribosomal protein L25